MIKSPTFGCLGSLTMVDLSLRAKAQSFPTIAYLRCAVQVYRTYLRRNARFQHPSSLAPHKSPRSRHHFRHVRQSFPRSVVAETWRRGNFPMGPGATSSCPGKICTCQHNCVKAMVSKTRCRGNFPMGRSVVPIARHNFRSALQSFPRAMVPVHGSLGKIHNDAEWTPRAIGDFRRPIVLVCMVRDNILIDE
jgi:hypothetical protein